MRIAILADPLDLQHAGIHQYTAQLIDALAQYDNDNEYIVLRQKPGNIPEGMQQVVVPGLWPFHKLGAFRNFFSLPHALGKIKVDAVFEPAHFGPFNLNKGILRITMVHDITPILFPETHPWSSVLAHKMLMGRVLKNADLVLTNSENTSMDLIQHFRGTHNNIKKIYLGRDPFFLPSEDLDALANFGIKQPYFLNVGTIEPRKNLLTLLEAYELYRNNRGTNLLVITGKSGWKTKAFADALHKNNYRKDIILTGFVPKTILRNLYSSATALIYPSLYEGFGIPVVEAMACGCPVIVSDTSSLREVGGTAALKFSPLDSEGLADQMRKVGTDEKLRSGLILAGKAQAEKFTWEGYVQAFKRELSLLS